jgi:hypothetical protein
VRYVTRGPTSRSAVAASRHRGEERKEEMTSGVAEGSPAGCTAPPLTDARVAGAPPVSSAGRHHALLEGTTSAEQRRTAGETDGCERGGGRRSSLQDLDPPPASSYCTESRPPR